MTKYLSLIVLGGLFAFGAGCGDSASGTGGTGASGGSGGTGGGGGQADLCQEAGGSGLVEIDVEEITGDTLLTADCTYALTQKTYVVGATLTIDAGVEIGGDNGSALVITTDARIDAQGTADDPIIMTSSRLEGQRLAGDWGGLVLLGKARLSWGNAPCNGEAGECVANIEGLPDSEGRGRFGGNDDTHDCGTLKYVRVEYAGFTIGLDNELNSLSVGGCGDQTTLDYIQLHRGLDDGAEFFGGTANISHLLVSGTGDDGLDWDQGYRGQVTNFIVHHFAGSSSDPRGIEGDNLSSSNDVQPRSAPEVSFGTIVASGTGSTDQGVVLRRGSWGVLSGLVVSSFADAGVDLRDGAWAQGGGWPDGIVVEDSCFWDNNPNYPVDEGCDLENPISDCNDSDGSEVYFPENVELAEAALGNSSDQDPMLGDISPATDGGTPDYSVGNAACAGAFAPDGIDWTSGWTAFPAN